MTTLKSEERDEYTMRDSILKLVSDDEIARVSTAETAPHLEDDEEYLDLGQVHRGVRRAVTAPMGRVLPRRAVTAATWSRIVGLLASQRVGR